MKHAWTFALTLLLLLTAAGCDSLGTDGDGDDSDGGDDRASTMVVAQRAVA